jgi:hypothetical protein
VPAEPPNPHGYEPGTVDPGNKHEDYDRAVAQGVDSMQLVLRAATHLDSVPRASAASCYGEAVSTYYTLAWFDPYLKGRTDPRAARDGYRRLTANVFEDSNDRHNISQGVFDPLLTGTGRVRRLTATCSPACRCGISLRIVCGPR